jgi:hypothetical protein
MKKKIILAVIAIIIIGGGIWLAKGTTGVGSLGSQAVRYTDPSDATSGFYNQWLKAAQDPTATPDRATLAKSAVLSKDVSATVAAGLASGATPDPVLCQSAVPQAIVQRQVYVQADKAQMLVTSKDKSVYNEAVVTLDKVNDSWLITKIECTPGEIAPVKEFSFEKEGYLIKGSIPKPYNNKNWHLVFVEDGKPGNVVPLFFDAKSQCTNSDGTMAVCKPDQFVETDKVSVHGQMSESGVTVVRLQFVK